MNLAAPPRPYRARPKDLADAQDVMAVQGRSIDRAYIEDWCQRLGVHNRYLGLLASVPDV